MGGMDSASGLWALLRREAPETVALAGALEAREAARKWFEECAPGAAWPSTATTSSPRACRARRSARALDAAMGAALDGEAVDRDAQLAVALQAE